MSKPHQDSRPSLAPGCRWAGPNDPERMLLFPEGAIRVQGTGLEILLRCDGRHSFAEIVEQLQALYSRSDGEAIQREAGDFLEQLRGKRIVDF